MLIAKNLKMDYARKSLEIETKQITVPVTFKLGDALMDFERIQPAN
jgi:hypothetical protein